MLAESQSAALQFPAADLETIPGLVDALNGLTAGVEDVLSWVPQKGFDLKRYEKPYTGPCWRLSDQSG